MPFPPTPTNPWDITQPPDTQAANLLGQDLRNVRVDVMQRMSQLSGTFANRPTPETVNAVWGGTGFGLIYISTDTQQTFQWNGAAWVDISFVYNLTKKFSDITQPTVTNPGVVTTLNSAATPVGFTTGNIIQIASSVVAQPVSSSFTIAISIGGGNLLSETVTVNATYVYALTILAVSSTEMQIYGNLTIQTTGTAFFVVNALFPYTTGTSFNIATATGTGTGIVTGEGISAFMV